jgi:deazaflavin-dependent oxidoreductase (nitroreductase family)
VFTYSEFLRRIYRSGKPNRVAKAMNRASAAMFSAGVWPRRLGTLVVPGRRSGRPIAFPVVLAEHGGECYLVAMLGERTNWVRNVDANDGRAVLRHGRREPVRLEPVPVADRAPILRQYLTVAPGARPHIPVDRRAPIEEFKRVAPDFPVFRVETAAS